MHKLFDFGVVKWCVDLYVNKPRMAVVSTE
uniref:Uncharacterized protein n=1 Tax=Anguilla anguilla TaxID=7936 RepID=A0A0E9RCI4_ANGAN